MTWDDFYDRYYDWSESTLKTRISSLEDIGPGEDVVDVVLNVSDEKIKAQLVRKAMRLDVTFTQDDFMTLEGELYDDVYKEVAEYGGFYLDNPYFDENDFDWDEFYAECVDLPEAMILRCIPRINKFGESDEVVDAILSVSYPADDALYDRAIACGVKFTKEQQEAMGRTPICFLEELRISDEDTIDSSECERPADKPESSEMERSRNPPKDGTLVGKAFIFGAIIDLFKDLFGGGKLHSRRCNGDCANCPPHYGYRYGRWYFGHGHNHGCELGGNKGDGGRD